MDNINIMINDFNIPIDKMDPEILAGGILFIVGLFAVMVAFTIIRYLLIGLGYSKMYRKAGEAPWKAFIPVYHTYNNYKISWNPKMFFLYAALNIVSTVIGIQTEGMMAMLAGAVSLGVVVMFVMQNIKMAKLFGKGTGTGIALMFFPGITSLILGLGKAEFQK